MFIGGLDRGRDFVEARDERLRRRCAGKLRERAERQVETVQRAVLGLLHLAGNRGVGEDVANDEGARKREELAEALALVHRTCFAADLGVSLAEQRVVDVGIDGHQLHAWIGWGLAAEAVAPDPVDLPRLPGAQALRHLLRIARRVAGRAERVEAETRGRLMVLAAPSAVGAHREHHVRPRRANQADVIAKDLVLAPLLERLVDAERQAEVHGAREELLGAVAPMRSQQLFRTQHAERFEDLGTDFVLPAVATRCRGEDYSQPLPAALHRHQAVRLVVRVRGDVHDGADRRQLTQHQRERHFAALGGDSGRREDGAGGKKGRARDARARGASLTLGKRRASFALPWGAASGGEGRRAHFGRAKGHGSTVPHGARRAVGGALAIGAHSLRSCEGRLRRRAR